MANNLIKMLQIRRIFQLRAQGASKRKISRLTQISRNTVREYLTLAQRLGLSAEGILKLSDQELGSLFYCEPNPPERDGEQQFILSKLETYIEELSKTGVTRQLLWQEYFRERPDGYAYTRFCYFISRHLKKNNCVMHFEHKPGEKVMVDFAGQTMFYVNKETGEVIQCQVFVAVFSYSNYCYVEAVHSQKQEDFIGCLVNALKYFGGVPQCILSDNLKSAVKRSNRYEPTLTELAEQLGLHYNTTLMATRVAKPKDKPHVESAVRTVYTRIYAPLRHREFFTLPDLNAAILEQLAIHNTLPFQRKEHCRKDMFLTHELPLLKPLPEKDFEVKQVVEAKVQKNYHIILGENWHQYSVPYEYVGEQVKIIYTRDLVEVYHKNGKRIAMHPRNCLRNGYTTLEEHMPQNHQHYQKVKGWNETDFKRMAQHIGPNTLAVIEKVLSSRMFHEQTYHSCLGILRLGKTFDNNRLEAACGRASNLTKVSYRIINNILKNHLDKEIQPTLFRNMPEHDNIRGAQHYQ